MKKHYLTTLLILALSPAFVSQTQGSATQEQSGNQTEIVRSTSKEEKISSDKVSNVSATIHVNQSENPVGRESANVAKKEIPADFPKYVDTGNEALDVQTYYDALQVWVDQNPGRYEEIFGKAPEFGVTRQNRVINKVSPSK